MNAHVMSVPNVTLVLLNMCLVFLNLDVFVCVPPSECECLSLFLLDSVWMSRFDGMCLLVNVSITITIYVCRYE